MPRILFYFVLFSLGFMPLVGLATHPPDPAGRGSALEDEKQLIREKRDSLKQGVKQKREELKENLEGKRDTLKKGIKEKGDILRNEVKEKRTTFYQEVKEKRGALQSEIKDRKEKFMEDARVRRDELKKKLGEKRAERIEAFFNKMVEKFEKVSARLYDFSERIASRLDKAAANGKDVSQLREKLTAAQNKIAEADKALEDAKARYTEVTPDPDFRNSFKEVRELVQAVKEKVKASHSALVDVVNSIKGLGREDGERKDRNMEITAGGFAPATLRIKIGTTVHFVNRDSALHWPASGVHPTHQICPGFDALKGLAKDETYSFTFAQSKTCPMHDHLNPSLNGAIIIEP